MCLIPTTLLGSPVKCMDDMHVHTHLRTMCPQTTKISSTHALMATIWSHQPDPTPGRLRQGLRQSTGVDTCIGSRWRVHVQYSLACHICMYLCHKICAGMYHAASWSIVHISTLVIPAHTFGKLYLLTADYWSIASIDNQ